MNNLNCDQALLWVATRSRQLVHEAGGEWRVRQRTWIQSCLEVYDPETGIYGAPFIMSRRAAEAKLLEVLARKRDRVTATWANLRIKRAWFLRAKFFDFTGPNASFPARLHGGLGLKHVLDEPKVVGPQL